MLILAILISIYVLISYALINRYGTLQFDWANAIAMIPSGYVSYVLGAYHAVVISVAFGMVAVVRIVRCYRS
jgi:cell division protein FtsX